MCIRDRSTSSGTSRSSYACDKDGKRKLAIMDVVVNFPGTLAMRWCDVSVRSPHAERYAAAATT
eukprot:1199878-Alexandrium_andersonii.AAC.1